MKIVNKCRSSGMGDLEWCRQNHIDAAEFFAGIGALWMTGNAIPDRCQKPGTDEEWEEGRACLASGLRDRDWCVLNGSSLTEFRKTARKMRESESIPGISKPEWLDLIKECNESGRQIRYKPVDFEPVKWYTVH